MRGPRPPAPRPPAVLRALSLIGDTVEYWMAAALGLSMVAGVFTHPRVPWMYRIGILILPFLVCVYKILQGLRRRPAPSGGVRPLLGLSLLFLTILNAAIAVMPEGWFPVIFPVNYILLPLLMEVLTPWEAVPAALVPAGLEALTLAWAGAGEEAFEAPAVHGALSLVSVLTVGVLLVRRRQELKKIQDQHEEREMDAKALMVRPAGGGSADLKALSKESREAQAHRAKDELEEKLHSIMEVIFNTLHPHVCVLFMKSDDGVFRFKDMWEPSELVNTECRFKAGEGQLGWVAKEKRHFLTSEVEKTISNIQYYTRDEGTRSFLAVPILTREEEVEGVLAVDSLQVQAFTEEHRMLLEFASRQIMETINYVKVLRQTESEAQEFEVFNHASKKFSGSLDLEQVIPLVVESAMDIRHSDIALFALYDPEARTYSVNAVRTGPRASKNIVRWSQEWVGKSFGLESLIGHTVANHRMVVPFDNVSERSREFPIAGPEIRIEGMDSCLVAPFVMKNDILGVLAMFSAGKKAFSEYDIKIIDTLRNQVSLSIQNAQMYTKMEEMARTDGLTGLFNHKTFQEHMNDEISRIKRHGSAVSLLLVDIDFFKKINDKYGHPMGDQVLKRVAHVLKKAIRETDRAARYGGEEFAVILTNTDKRGAVKKAEHIRKAVAQEVFQAVNNEEFSVTLSVGASTCPEDGQGKQEIIDKADSALYMAKRRGRNRVETYVEEMDKTSVAVGKEEKGFRL